MSVTAQQGLRRVLSSLSELMGEADVERSAYREQRVQVQHHFEQMRLRNAVHLTQRAR